MAIPHKLCLLVIAGICGLFSPISNLQAAPSDTTAHDSTQVPDSVRVLHEQAVKIFVDCPPYSESCDLDYFRTQLGFVNFVRDRKEAQVDILISTMSTGNGGTQYTLSFIGQNGFSGVNDTLTYDNHASDTKEINRKGLLRVMKLGLVRYAARSPLANKISIDYSEPTAPAKVTDKWNYWVFSVTTGGYFDGQKAYRSLSNWGEMNMNRITENRKVLLSLYFNYSQDTFVLDDGSVEHFPRERRIGRVRRRHGRPLVMEGIRECVELNLFQLGPCTGFRSIPGVQHLPI